MANGATMEAYCPNKCKCWAEFGMKTWSGIKYQSCKFLKKGELYIWMVKKLQMFLTDRPPKSDLWWEQ